MHIIKTRIKRKGYNGKFSKNDKTELLKDAANIAQKALIKLIEEVEVNWEDLKLEK